MKDVPSHHPRRRERTARGSAVGEGDHAPVCSSRRLTDDEAFSDGLDGQIDVDVDMPPTMYGGAKDPREDEIPPHLRLTHTYRTDARDLREAVTQRGVIRARVDQRPKRQGRLGVGDGALVRVGVVACDEVFGVLGVGEIRTDPVYRLKPAASGAIGGPCA